MSPLRGTRSHAAVTPNFAEAFQVVGDHIGYLLPMLWAQNGPEGHLLFVDNDWESAAIAEFTRFTLVPKFLVVQAFTGLLKQSTRTLRRESVGRGFEPRPPHLRGTFGYGKLASSQRLAMSFPSAGRVTQSDNQIDRDGQNHGPEESKRAMPGTGDATELSSSLDWCRTPGKSCQ